MKTKLLFLLALVLCNCGHEARAWDAAGHMIVVRIALDRLSPEVRAAVNDDLAKFNARMRTQFDLVSASCWMDDVRPQTQLYGPWHYIDLPLHGGEKVDPKTLPEPNGFWLARNCLAMLNGGPSFAQAHDGQPIDRPLALVMFLHVEGDLHQPLHTTGNDDRGGNDVAIPNMLEVAKARNLHHLWDSGYRRQMQGTAIGYFYETPYQSHMPWAALHALAEPWVADQASAWALKYAPAAGWKVGTPESWLREGFGICTRLVYGKLPGGLDVKSAILPKEYVDEMDKTAHERIVLAGFRLAEILKQAYAPGAQAATPQTGASSAPSATPSPPTTVTTTTTTTTIDVPPPASVAPVAPTPAQVPPK